MKMRTLDEAKADYRKTLPAKERDKWHITTIDPEDRDEREQLGYEVCKVKGKELTYGGDLMVRLPAKTYAAMLKG